MVQVQPEIKIGRITHYFDHISVGIIELAEPLKVGDKIHIKGNTTDYVQNVDSIQLEHQQIQEGQPGQSVGIKVTQPVREHDTVYRTQ